ncbi:hypothetical protein HD554DRAFT_2313539 [Boletus coccyginus]|nr:hypothetical protein HD554DRAFT_2313539 [Boletus coccyginus]
MARLDDEVNKELQNFLPRKLDSDGDIYTLLQGIADHSSGELNRDTRFLREKLRDPEKGPSLREKLVTAWDAKEYHSIRAIGKIMVYSGFNPPPPPPLRQETSDEAFATERAWNVDYVGDVATVLLDRIKKSLPGPKRDYSPSSARSLYARYTAIIQSSGMGKSRAVDEIAKGELVIPMVLRPHDSTGYPPADPSIRNYLADSKPGVFQRVLAFLDASFVILAEVAESTEAPSEGLAPLNKSMPFARQFREYMNHGMTMTRHGEFREKFYDRVIKKADAVLEAYQKKIPTNSDSAGLKVDSEIKKPSFLLSTKCEALLKALKVFRDPSSFVILSFDEMDILKDNYLEFRRALRALIRQPVFSLFLSTAGHMYNTIRNPTVDPSARMVRGGWVIPPFSELGFDHFAKHTNLAGGQDAMETDDILAHVSSTAQLVKFGRPLWATRYNEGDTSVQADIIEFAASKLLGGIDPWGLASLELPHQLGCLAQRLPIEFLSSSYSSSLANPQTVQVQSHLRVVIRVVNNLETMITTTPSEPILSEAAYWVMNARQFKPATALKRILGGFSVDRGDRGELLVMLLLTIARDNAVGPPVDFGVPESGLRYCSVRAFLSSLFVESAWTDAIGDRQPVMEVVLGDGKLYFNHFVKVHEHKMLNTKYITRLMTRGAAILCANGQKGVDLVIPFTHGGLTAKDLGVILVQVKNDQTYNADPKPDKFRQMSIKGLSNIPSLRLFFALAAKRSCLTVVNMPCLPSDTFNFWIAGLSSGILRPIRAEGDAVWKGLLDASYGWKEIYIEHGRRVKEKENREKLTNIRRSMYPGGATADAHWRSWCDMEEEEEEGEEGEEEEEEEREEGEGEGEVDMDVVDENTDMEGWA